MTDLTDKTDKICFYYKYRKFGDKEASLKIRLKCPLTGMVLNTILYLGGTEYYGHLIMYYLKNKYFARWARKQAILDHMPCDAIQEFENGLFEANLGNHLFKKRIALSGKGKSGGTRTILFYQKGKKLIFCFGFSKNQQDNLDGTESVLLHKLSDAFQKMPEEAVIKNIKHKELIKIAGMEVSS